MEVNIDDVFQAVIKWVNEWERTPTIVTRKLEELYKALQKVIPDTGIRAEVKRLRDEARGLSISLFDTDPAAAKANKHYQNAYQIILDHIDTEET